MLPFKFVVSFFFIYYLSFSFVFFFICLSLFDFVVFFYFSFSCDCLPIVFEGHIFFLFCFSNLNV